MQTLEYRHLFGPVPSRRFGRSLGIDLLRHKSCTLDCIFCQLGRTTRQTLIRDHFVPTADVIDEIGRWFDAGGHADYLTLSGSGEPTLHAGFGQVLASLRATSIPSALLTNGTLFDLPEVREAAGLADVVKVSLSAWDQRSFARVNRPHPRLVLTEIIAGLRRFREQYPGRLWLEVFLLAGINDMPDDVAKIAHICRSLRPERIHLNTVVRPPAEAFAAPVPQTELQSLGKLFDPPAEIALAAAAPPSTAFTVNSATVLAMLKRRPCTTEQIQAAFGLHANEIVKLLGDLIRRDQIQADTKRGQTYYRSIH